MSLPTDFLSAAHSAAGVRRALEVGNVSSADRIIAEMAARILAASASECIPDFVFDEPESSGALEYDTLIATVLAFSMIQRNLPPQAWMSSATKLPAEWLWDGGYGGSLAFRDLIRRDTPALFLEKNILLRPRDLIAPRRVNRRRTAPAGQ